MSGRSSRPGFRTCCPRCGAPFPIVVRGEWLETSPRCAECGVAVRDDSPQLAPSDWEIAYDLSELPLIVRTAITADMIEVRVPFRWDDALVLVVPPSAEDYMDQLIDDVTADDPAADAPGERP